MNNKILAKISAILDNAKTEDISIIDLKNKTSVADFFIIASCRSSKHADATADDIISKCHQCGSACDNHVNCNNVNCNLLFLQCKVCRDTYQKCCFCNALSDC